MRLPKAGKGPTAVATLSKRWATVEAKAAAISTLGYVYKRLKAQLRRLEPKALLWGMATSLGQLAAGSFVERSRRAGDLLCRRARGRRQAVGRLLAALHRGWQQAVVRSLAALEAQAAATRGHRSGRGFCDFIASVGGHSAGHGQRFRRGPEQTCQEAERADPLMLSSIFSERQPNGQIWATDGQIRMTLYKEFISGQEKHFQPLSRPMAILSRPMAIL